jgi:hypothetical protein
MPSLSTPRALAANSIIVALISLAAIGCVDWLSEAFGDRLCGLAFGGLWRKLCLAYASADNGCVSSVTYPAGVLLHPPNHFGLPGDDLTCSFMGGRTMAMLSLLPSLGHRFARPLHSAYTTFSFLSSGDVCVSMVFLPCRHSLP